MKISRELVNKVRLKVAESMGKADRFYSKEFPMPEVCFDIRGHNVAGRAHSHHWKVDFNVSILLENEEHFIKQTVPHECAHLVAFAVHGAGQKHNHNWRFIMEEVMEIPADIYHDYTTKERMKKFPYRYVCGCQYHYFTQKKHLASEKGRYRKCNSCGKRCRYQPYDRLWDTDHDFDYWLLASSGGSFTVPHDLWVWLLSETKAGVAVGCSSKNGYLMYKPDFEHRSPFNGGGFEVSSTSATPFALFIDQVAGDNKVLADLAEFVSNSDGFMIFEDDDTEDDEDENE